ncbi:MAG: ATP-binding cassette domain-containing protein, partial [Paracoccaceae bacterium]
MARVPVLSLKDLSLSFGGNPILNGLSLNLQEGERLALVGRNGSGKSTLLKVLAGLIEPDRGTRIAPAAAGIGYMEQHPDFSGFA